MFLIFLFHPLVLPSYLAIQGKIRFRSTITSWRYASVWQAACWEIRENIKAALKYSPAVFFFFQVIFGELFQLPAPPHIDVMYTTLLIELCKLQPGSLPQVVSFIVCVTAVYVNTVFQHAPDMSALSAGPDFKVSWCHAGVFELSVQSCCRKRAQRHSTPTDQIFKECWW